MEITVIVNGKKLVDSIEPDLLLIDFLRKHGCYSVKRGCEKAKCGLFGRHSCAFLLRAGSKGRWS
mgnify:CR=1 FL=1